LKFDLRNKFKIDSKDTDTKNPIQENGIEDEKLKANTLKSEMIASILKGSVVGEEDKTVTFADLNAVEEELEPKNQQKSIANVEKNKDSQKTQRLEENFEEKIEKKLIAKLEEKLSAKIQVEQQKIPSLNEHETKKSLKRISPDTEKISSFITAIETSKEKKVVPFVDLEHGKITYPILTQIGETDDNLDFLEKLASQNFDILERIVHERLVVCPDHPESLSTSVRLSCPRCKSLDISKLHLIEHKRCGYISENKNFEISEDGKIISCPSCKKQIRDANKEIAKPAMWYSCNECSEKFDDVSLKLYCRKFNHDFEISESHSILIPGFVLKNLQDTSNTSISPILNPLKKLLGSFGFSADENYTVTGKSGNHYRINIFGEDEHKRTVFIYIKNPNGESDNSELNSKIIEVLDTSPTVTILIGFPSISEKAKAITSNYNISLITEQDPHQILSSIKDILSEKVPSIES
jgi:hypothetical protein